MTRAIAVVLATLLLLTVGFFLGRRPVPRLTAENEAAQTEYQLRIDELEGRATIAEARGYLWQARAQLLLAALAIEHSNFGTASEHGKGAQEMLTRAAAVPGMTLDLGQVHTQVAAALKRIRDLDTGARGSLEQAATTLGHLLDRTDA